MTPNEQAHHDATAAAIEAVEKLAQLMVQQLRLADPNRGVAMDAGIAHGLPLRIGFDFTQAGCRRVVMSVIEESGRPVDLATIDCAGAGYVRRTH
ncbi:hypothetical protein [Dokdonella immobilis]|uniref:Uncharacterized protein n=1 Tax=Dokdonella immobilis TaxID=578942 RepID=A0A1I4VVM1_9GAMM|nr:hypothetical protein [Dokdonella immobilis]SFN05059.1 hypothetical protein SAMN05216289_10379 [Dokdonella immobilis]